MPLPSRSSPSPFLRCMGSTLPAASSSTRTRTRRRSSRHRSCARGRRRRPRELLRVVEQVRRLPRAVEPALVDDGARKAEAARLLRREEKVLDDRMEVHLPLPSSRRSRGTSGFASSWAHELHRRAQLVHRLLGVVRPPSMPFSASRPFQRLLHARPRAARQGDEDGVESLLVQEALRVLELVEIPEERIRLRASLLACTPRCTRAIREQPCGPGRGRRGSTGTP